MANYKIYSVYTKWM